MEDLYRVAYNMGQLTNPWQHSQEYKTYEEAKIAHDMILRLSSQHLLSGTVRELRIEKCSRIWRAME